MHRNGTALRRLCVLLALVLAASLCAPAALAASASDFTDVPAGAWYGEELSYAVSHGLVNGTSATTFAPTEHMTRAQFVTILGRAMIGVSVTPPIPVNSRTLTCPPTMLPM